ncbi:MAG: hypothetical protein AABZ06_13685 [Bdellovibrionota bacterium]
MNCFEWQNCSSDFLDGIMVGSSKREAEEHVESCSTCGERHRHLRLILSLIAKQPRSSLPIQLRKSPLRAHTPQAEGRPGFRARWHHLPWYVRMAIEGISIVTSVLILVTFAPKLKTVYENYYQRDLYSDDFTQGNMLLSSTQSQEQAVPESNSENPLFTRGNVNLTTAPSEDDFSTNEPSGDTANAPSLTKNSEIWRFNVRTDSPHDTRSKVVNILGELRVPKSTDGLGGIEVPGGIQFDLLLPNTVVHNLRTKLQKLSAKQETDKTADPALETFSWYKNKSSKQIPEGKTRVVIWLSQM